MSAMTFWNYVKKAALVAGKAGITLLKTTGVKIPLSDTRINTALASVFPVGPMHTLMLTTHRGYFSSTCLAEYKKRRYIVNASFDIVAVRINSDVQQLELQQRSGFAIQGTCWRSVAFAWCYHVMQTLFPRWRPWQHAVDELPGISHQDKHWTIDLSALGVWSALEGLVVEKLQGHEALVSCALPIAARVLTAYVTILSISCTPDGFVVHAKLAD